LRLTLVAALLGIYSVAALYPFKLAPAINEAQWIAGGGIQFDNAGLASSSKQPDWVIAAMRTNRLKIRLRLRPASPRQWGPARIMTLSLDYYLRNFTVAQVGSDLALRLRTPRTDLDGLPEIRVPEVFNTTDWIHLAIDIAPGALRMSVNGHIRVLKTLPQAPLANWDPSYRLALGNEVIGARPWLGTIARASIRTPGTRSDYAVPGSLAMPLLVWTRMPSPMTLVPFADMRASDTLVNILGFIPLGFLLGYYARPKGVPWRALVFIAGVSASLEVLQVFFVDRITSVNDLIFNTLGGGIGIALWRRIYPAPKLSQVTMRSAS
jgi:hypothetical protein